MKNEKSRFTALANLLVGYSTGVKFDETAIIECYDVPQAMTEAIVDQVRQVGGRPIVWQKSWARLETILLAATEKEIERLATAELEQMKQAAVYISLRAASDQSKLANVPRAKMALFQNRWLGQVHYQYRVHYTRWCSGKWPTVELAQSARMELEEFEDFFFRVCTETDYRQLNEAMDPLVNLLAQTERVRITAPGTEVSFTIKGIPVVKYAGTRNLPDGEVMTAPVRDSVAGQIAYNTPTTYQGRSYGGIELTIDNGRIVSVSCQEGDQRELETVFNTDTGARYFGEFAFGVNPLITQPINDTMFDEKMAGSIHLTPGNSYRDAFNGNQSSIHWDLILNQMPDYGGGNIYFDDVLIRQDGIFILPELRGLNPNRLSL